MTVQKRGRKPNQNKQQTTEAPESVVSNDNQEVVHSPTEKEKTSENATQEVLEPIVVTPEEEEFNTKIIKTPFLHNLVDELLELCNNNEVKVDPSYRPLIDSYPFTLRVLVGKEKDKTSPTSLGHVLVKEDHSVAFLAKLVEYGNKGYKRNPTYNFSRYPYNFMLS